MSATDKAWTNLVDCFFLKCRGESWLELRDAINAYAAAAVAEARAPLVEALRAVEWVRHGCEYEKNSWCPACDTEEHYGHAADCPRAAALAKEVP